DYLFNIGVAGADFPRAKRYYVAVDSGRDIFTGKSLAGAYVLRSWINDLTPPKFKLLTRRVTAGRPLLAARVTDTGSGVDPLSLVIEYRPRVPLGTSCARRAVSLVVAASAPWKITSVQFYDGGRLVSTVRRGTLGLYTGVWRTRGAKRGPHHLRVVLRSGGRSAQARRNVRVCR